MIWERELGWASNSIGISRLWSPPIVAQDTYSALEWVENIQCQLCTVPSSVVDEHDRLDFARKPRLPPASGIGIAQLPWGSSISVKALRSCLMTTQLP